MKQRKVISILFLAPVLLSVPVGLAAADERIHDYHSDIQVLKNGSLQVTDRITVSAEGHKVKRGIYRDFPIAYTSRFLVPIKLPFHQQWYGDHHVVCIEDGRPRSARPVRAQYHVTQSSDRRRGLVLSVALTSKRTTADRPEAPRSGGRPIVGPLYRRQPGERFASESKTGQNGHIDG